jgi:hypothetical protein
MAGSILELLEIAGPDAVRAQLEELPRPQRVDVRIWPCNRVVDLIGMIALWGN